jgi:plastocyanin
MVESPRSVVRKLAVAAAIGGAALAGAPAAPGARVVAAQGTVGGRITIVERAGSRTGDLENAVVWLEPAASVSGVAGASGVASTGQGAPGIVMESRRFRPAVRVVAPGSAVPFPNEDPFRHNVFSNAGPAAFDLGLYGRGEVRSARVARPGIYPIFCNIHARMAAYVVAVPTRWYAQAGSDGRYEIAGVPAGRYHLRAWHDRGGEQTRDVTVTADARVQGDVELDARGWRDLPHRNKFGQDYPPEARDRY